MKTLLLLVCVLGSVSLFAQNLPVLDATPHPTVMFEHAQQATQQSIAMEQTLLHQSPFTSDHGDRPLWEFASKAPERPLGDLAREFKNEHEVVRKSDVVWINK